MTAIPPRHGDHPSAGRSLTRRWVPFAAATTAAALTAAAVLTAGGGAAGAATPPQAQSVGNFLDAALSGRPIDDIAKLEYARATSPGSQSTQNPLNATVLNAINLPLTGVLQLPKLAGADVGVLNQVAVAKHSGESYGASGAVLNSGGVSIGGDNTAFPDVATVDLCASALSGSSCGSGAADAIGRLRLALGAVSGVASTPEGYGKAGSTDYAIAGVDLSLSSPLLGQLLGTVNTTLSGLVTQLTGLLGQVAGLPADCSLTAGFGTVSLEDGAISLDATDGSLTISLDKLVKVLLGKSINELPANTDLLKYLLDYLADPNGLAKGLVNFVNGLTDPLKAKLDACATALGNSSVIGQVVGLLKSLTDALDAGKTTLENTITQIVSGLGGVDASALLDPLTNLLKSVVDIGINVQPNGAAGTFDTGLDATPKQGTPVVADQTIVRAIEVDLLSSGGLTPAAVRKAKARKASDPLVALALGNAAAGPSNAPAAATSSPAGPSPSTSEPATNVPTGVPAGQGKTGGAPPLPVILLALAAMAAAGTVISLRARGGLNKH